MTLDEVAKSISAGSQPECRQDLSFDFLAIEQKLEEPSHSQNMFIIEHGNYLNYKDRIFKK